MKSHIVIPARLASTRLPRKLLLRETGKSLLQHTHEAARRARKPSGICVATDHDEIACEVRSFGGDAVMTSRDCASGTDRVAEVARQLPGVEIFVNVQGDEPELRGESIDLVIELLEINPKIAMSTLATPIRRREQLEDPACVKVVFAAEAVNAARQSPISPIICPAGGRALYFSRSPIPHARKWSDDLLTSDPPSFYQHVGLYAYRRDFLIHLAEMAQTPLERLENLEQLRVLESGHSIAVGVVDEPTFGIDTPEDYRAFVSRVLAG